MSTLAKKNDMTSGSIYKSLITFAIPIALSNFFQQLYSAVDGVVLGAFVSKEALAATNVMTVLSLIICLFVGLGSGAGVVVARYYGAKDGVGISRAVHTALLVSLISGALLTVVGLALSRPLLLLMNFGEVIDLSNTYMSILFAGMIPRLLYNISAGILRAVGESRRSFYYLVAGGITNIVLDILFVAVFKWGVVGAAVATVIAETVSVVLSFIYFSLTKDIYKISLKELRVHKDMLLSIAKVGLPMGFLSMGYHLPHALLQASINSFGVAAMAGGSAFSKIGNFLDVSIQATEASVATFVSQNIGAGKLDRVKKCARAGLVLSVGITAVLSIAVFVLAKPVIGTLVEWDAKSIEYGLLKMKCVLPFYVLAAAMCALEGVLQGGGATFEMMVLGLIFSCGVRMLVVIFVLPVWHELYVVYLTYPLMWTLQGGSYVIYYKFGKWMKTNI